MASTSSTNVNEILPGLEDFLRSMLSSTHLDTDHRQIAALYLDKLDQHSQLTTQQSSNTDDQSLMNTDVISEEESDDFTDEEEEEHRQRTTPTLIRQSSICDNQLYNSTKQESDTSNSQWYIDIPQKDCLESQFSNEQNETSSSIIPDRSSISTSSVIADGLLLTYDKNHNWIWRYYVLDDFDLICFPADKKSRLTNQGQSNNDCSPLWVSDMTNAKVHPTVIDKIECLCIQIGLAEAIYVRPSDPDQMNTWLKAFRDASSSSSQKSKDQSKTRSNVKTLSRNARRMFAQFNRKKGQIVSHLLDQMANVTGVDDKTRKNCELRGFLVVSLDNSTFITKYCTIVDGIFRIHKSRLSDQTDHEFDLNQCTLSFPEERTRDIQFALINNQIGRIFIRGNNIYSMGRLLNTLAKYVEIKGSSKHVFQVDENNTADAHTDVDSSSTIKSLPSDITKNIYRSASQLHDDRVFTSPTRQSGNPSIQNSNEIYDQPKAYDNLSSIDRNNNHLAIPPQPRARSRNENSHSGSQSDSLKMKSTSPDRSSISSSENTVFCTSSHHRRRPHPLPRRSSIDCVNKLTNLFSKNSNERHISTQTSDTITSSSKNFQSSLYNSNRIQPLIKNDEARSKRVYDIPVTIEHPTRFIVPPFEQLDKSTFEIEEDEETVYDNVSKSDGIGKFRFVIPFNHSPRSAFTTIKPINSPSSSSSSTISSNSTMPQTSSSSDHSNTNTNNNNNNNSNNRTRLMTAV